MNNDYITSENSIHEGLLEESKAMVEHIYTVWSTQKKMPALAFTWPATTVFSDDGIPIDRIVSLTLPDESEERSKALRYMVERTKAYGLFVIDPKDDEIKAVLETPHGSRSWTIKVRRSGDVKILSRPTVQDNVESIGLLWRRSVGTA